MAKRAITYPTLGTFAAEYALSTYCPCGHGAEIVLDAMIEALGADDSIAHDALVRHLRCEKCGMQGLDRTEEGLRISIRIAARDTPCC